jgi:hypothetical protein
MAALSVADGRNLAVALMQKQKRCESLGPWRKARQFM